MDPLHKRFMLFLLGCIPSRLLLVLATMLMPLWCLKVFSILAAIVATGFWTIFLMGWRKAGLETQGAPIWWNMLRPIHGMLWMIVAYNAWHLRRDMVWKYLLADVCLGLVSFSIYHSFLS